MNERVEHPFGPVFSRESRALILGSFPSVRSRQDNFYYAHPGNRFWKVISRVAGRPEPVSTEEKRELILGEGLALWDPVASCTIRASYDSTIRDVVPNDLSEVLENSRIERIYCNGRKSHELYTRYILPETGIEAVYLPSTSGANAAWDLEKLVKAWSVILKDDRTAGM